MVKKISERRKRQMVTYNTKVLSMHQAKHEHDAKMKEMAKLKPVVLAVRLAIRQMQASK